MTEPTTPAETPTPTAESELTSYQENDGCPTEGAVLKREWRQMRAEHKAVWDVCANNNPNLTYRGNLAHYVQHHFDAIRQQHAEEVALKDRVILGIQAAVRSSGIDPLTQACSMSDPPNEATTAKAIRMIIAEREQLRTEFIATVKELEQLRVYYDARGRDYNALGNETAQLRTERGQALAAQAALMQQLADIHDLATQGPLTNAARTLAAIAERTKPHHTPV